MAEEYPSRNILYIRIHDITTVKVFSAVYACFCLLRSLFVCANRIVLISLFGNYLSHTLFSAQLSHV